VELSRRGGVVRLRVPGVFRGDRKKRGEIWEFSDSSARRLLTVCNAVDRQALSPDRMVFLTLTYPSVWPSPGVAGQTWKRQHRAFVKRLEREYGECGILTKLEPQKRGAPHFHMLVVLPSPYSEMVGGAKGVELWSKRAWYEVVGSGDEKHLHNGAHCEGLRSWRGVAGYCSSYMAKKRGLASRCFIDRETGELLKVGRFWMVHRRKLFRIEWEERELGPSEYVVFTRWLRRHVQARGWRSCRIDSVAGGTVFADAEAWRAVLFHPVFRAAVSERDSRLPGYVRACGVFGGRVVARRSPQPEVTDGAAPPPSAGKNPKLPRGGKEPQTEKGYGA